MSNRELLIANDLSPLHALQALKAEMEKRGHLCPLVEGRAEQTNILFSAADVELGLSGMSAPEANATLEVNALSAFLDRRAKGGKALIGLFSDRPMCWQGREWFNFAKAEADLLFVTLPREVEGARKMYPKARIVACGHPAREGTGPSMPREVVRRHILGDTHDDKFIVLCAGTKFPNVNLALIDGVLNVTSSFPNVIPVYSPHPGDKTDHAVYRAKGIRVIPKSEMPSIEILAGADMVVNTLSTLGYESAVMRIPNICYYPAGSLIAEARKSVFGEKDVTPFEVEEGSMLLAVGPETLRADLNRLTRLGPSAFAPLHRRQAELYPAWQASGIAVKIMADTIEELLNPVTTS